MSVRALAALAVVVALAIVLARSFGEDASPPPTEPAASPEDVTRSSSPSPATDALESSDAADSVTREQVAAAEEPTASDAEPDTAPWLTGTLVVRDRDTGQRFDDVDGTLLLVLWTGNSGRQVQLDVAAGRFAHAGEPAAASVTKVAVAGMKTPDRLVAVDSADDVGFVRGSPLQLTGMFARPTTLRVVSTQTGADLSGITVLTSVPWPQSSLPNPGRLDAGEIVVDDGRSPVAIEPRDESTWAAGQREFWITAIGHTWAKAKFDVGAGGDRQVQLDPAGGLEVSITGAELPDDALLVVRALRGDGTPEHRPLLMLETHGDPKPRVVTGLAPARYRVAIEKGNWWDQPLRLGQSNADVAAGRRQPVTVVVEAHDGPPRTTFAGLVVPPAGESAASIKLQLDALEETSRWLDEPRYQHANSGTTTEAGALRFHFGDLPAGAYEFIVSPWSFRRRIDLPASGLENYRLELPELVDVVVAVVADDTGERLVDANLNWHGELPEGVSGWSSENATAVGDGTFTLRAPLGKIVVSGQHAGFRWSRQNVDLHPGTNHVEVRMQRSCGIELVLRDGETRVPWDWQWNADLKQVDGDGTSNGWSGNHVFTSKPGRYTLKIGDIAGFEPIPKRTVEIAEGRLTEVVVELVRRR